VLLVDRGVVGDPLALGEEEARDGLARDVDEARDLEADRRLERVEDPMRLFWKTACGGLRVGSGIAAAWITASWPRTTAKASPASVRSARM